VTGPPGSKLTGNRRFSSWNYGIPRKIYRKEFSRNYSRIFSMNRFTQYLQENRITEK